MPSIHEVKGVGPTMAAALSEKGILTPEQLASMPIDDLLMVSGVGPARAETLIDAAKEAVGTPPSTSDALAEQNTQIATPRIVEERTKAGSSVSCKPSGGDKDKTKKPKKSGERRKTGSSKSDPAIRALRKEVKKRRAALKKQKEKLKRARKALKSIA